MKKSKLSYIEIQCSLSTLFLIMFIAVLPVYAADLGNVKALMRAKQAIKENPTIISNSETGSILMPTLSNIPTTSEKGRGKLPISLPLITCSRGMNRESPKLSMLPLTITSSRFDQVPGNCLNVERNGMKY